MRSSLGKDEAYIVKLDFCENAYSIVPTTILMETIVFLSADFGCEASSKGRTKYHDAVC